MAGSDWIDLLPFGHRDYTYARLNVQTGKVVLLVNVRRYADLPKMPGAQLQGYMATPFHSTFVELTHNLNKLPKPLIKAVMKFARENPVLANNLINMEDGSAKHRYDEALGEALKEVRINA
jgi:hypothetical protein